MDPLTLLRELYGEDAVRKVLTSGFDSADKIAAATAESLSFFTGINEALAGQIIVSAEEALVASAGARYQVSPQDDRRDPRDDSASRDRHHHRRSAPRGSPRHGHLGACHGRGGLTLTRFCDSYRLHALLRAHKLAHADGGELRLVTPLTARSSYLRPDLPGPLDTLLRQPGRGP